MASNTSHLPHLDIGRTAGPGADTAGLIGVAARGLLYLVLAGLAVELVRGSANTEVDTRGAFHELARAGVGRVALVILAIGFAAFALWHLYVALRGSPRRDDAKDRLADAARAIVYGLVGALAVSFLVAPRSSGNPDQASRVWTARLLDRTGGQLLVGIVGVAVVAVGLWLVWRACTGAPQDEHAVLEAAPRETETLHWLAAVGNVARGGVVALVGLFLVTAAVEYDPSEAVGLDGALRRVLDERFGEVLILLVAAGLAAFGVYSIARAWVNRRLLVRS
jgi:hypothetical protein